MFGRFIIAFTLSSSIAWAQLGPVECAKEADRLLSPNLTTPDIVYLCQGAQSAAPVFCVQKAYTLISPAFNKTQAMELCRGTTEAFMAYELSGEASLNKKSEK